MKKEEINMIFLFLIAAVVLLDLGLKDTIELIRRMLDQKVH